MNIKEQYGKPENLKNRIGLYRYSTSPQTFQQWIAAVLPRQMSISILELGCGTGELWKTLHGNFPDSAIVLSDNSENMLEEARANLKGMKLQFRKIDFNSIPYDDGSFDLIIANHNLYHAENLDTVLGEIKRVLTPDGTFLCSTNSPRHLMELKKILLDRGIKDLWPNGDLTEKFGMENGERILSEHFSSVNRYDYHAKLHITEARSILEYYSSFGNGSIDRLLEEKADEILKELNWKIQSGLFYEVSTRSGIFICHK
ncbi:MAG: class I SAM-dependent methyltransferase [Spirochaetales bacterium]|nr:class I SAM-dependent methyltransferase [Spirochaetales bacterium]